MKGILDKKPELAKAHSQYEKFTQSQKMRELYEARLMYERDQKSREHYAVKKGIEKAKREDAQRMLKDGLPVELVMRYTELSEEVVQQLMSEL